DDQGPSPVHAGSVESPSVELMHGPRDTRSVYVSNPRGGMVVRRRPRMGRQSRPIRGAQAGGRPSDTRSPVACPRRGHADARVHLAAPGRVAELGPVVRVESGTVLQALLVQVHHQLLVLGVHLEQGPWHGEELLSDSRDTTSTEDAVYDGARVEVDHELLQG